MRFALLGNHPDGLAMAKALAAAGNILVAVYDAPSVASSPGVQSYSDLEDLLADPGAEAVIVAGSLTVRFEQLRRAIQSERTTFCVHPCDEKLERAYEAAWMQGEAKQPLVPLLPNALHPAYSRLNDIVRDWGGMQLLKWESGTSTTDGAAFRGWDVLRKIGGEIVEISGVARTEEASSTDPLLFHGKFEKGGLIQATVLPGLHSLQRIVLVGPNETIDLDGPNEMGAACLRRMPSNGDPLEEHWNSWDRWTSFALVPNRVVWQDSIRSMELDDALNRSIEKRRASDLEYGDISEDAAGKGKITLIGCGMIWMILLVFALSVWIPFIRWAIVPMLLGFFALLALRWMGRSGKR